MKAGCMRVPRGKRKQRSVGSARLGVGRQRACVAEQAGEHMASRPMRHAASASPLAAAAAAAAFSLKHSSAHPWHQRPGGWGSWHGR